MSKAEQLVEVTLDINECRQCQLCRTRDKPTISRGDPSSPLMIISDLPRTADHKAVETLRGRAGKKLDELLSKAEIQPEKVFITSLLK